MSPPSPQLNGQLGWGVLGFHLQDFSNKVIDFWASSSEEINYDPAWTKLIEIRLDVSHTGWLGLRNASLTGCECNVSQRGRLSHVCPLPGNLGAEPFCQISSALSHTWCVKHIISRDLTKSVWPKALFLLFTLSPSLFWQGRSNSGSYINPGHGPTQPCAFPRGDYILCEWGRVVYSMMGTLHLCRVVERWKTFSSSSVFEGLTAQKSDFSFALS